MTLYLGIASSGDGVQTRALEQALKALVVASDKHAKEQDIVLVYEEAVAAILLVKGLHPDRVRMTAITYIRSRLNKTCCSLEIFESAWKVRKAKTQMSRLKYLRF